MNFIWLPPTFVVGFICLFGKELSSHFKHGFGQGFLKSDDLKVELASVKILPQQDLKYVLNMTHAVDKHIW